MNYATPYSHFGKPQRPARARIDVSVAIGEKLHAASGKDDQRPTRAAERIVAAGKLGR